MIEARQDLVRVYEAAVRAVEPAALVQQHLHRDGPWVCVRVSPERVLRWHGAALVVGAGKAAARMAAGCEAALGADALRGLVVVADGCTVPLDRIECLEAGHPIPDTRGIAATEKICALLSSATPEPALVLISGGASSLLVRPRPPVNLADKITVNELLLRSGVDIARVNAVRKHLSLVKGGGLLQVRRARPLVALILSDVVGDDPSVIGSGPTACDPTTFRDADGVLASVAGQSFDAVPETVRRLLAEGRRGSSSETVKPGDPSLDGVYNLVMASNQTALQAAAAEARRLGYEVAINPEPLVGDSATSARAWWGWASATMRSARRYCVLAGGETTVTVRGTGRGGRNLEFALALVPELAGVETVVLSAGTDGIDGMTDAAGAFVDGSTVVRARAGGLDPETMLKNNDSYHFFEGLGDLFLRGPTGTNVMDLKIAIAATS